jgi:predicted DNA-binding transcriptional regulator AlpA
MSAALKLAFPPRMMRRVTAAAYLDLSTAEFEREVAAGRLPMPVRFGNNEHWSREAIDDAVGKLTGDRVVSWRDKAKLYGAEG